MDALVVWLVWLRTLPQAKLRRQQDAEAKQATEDGQGN
jgi:hypothetical protein